MKRYFTPTKKKVIFFDMNGTLIDRNDAFVASLSETLQDFMGRWQSDDDHPSAAAVLDTYHAEMKRRSSGRNHIKASDTGQLQAVSLREALKPFPLPSDERFIETMLHTAKTNQAKHVRLKTDVKSALTALSKNYRLAIISNGPRERLEKMMHHSGLTSFIPLNRLISSQKGKWKKPDLAIFQHALKTMEVTASQTVMVGDSWRNDVKGALRSGMDAVWIRKNMSAAGEKKVSGKGKVILLSSFQQLVDIF